MANGGHPQKRFTDAAVDLILGTEFGRQALFDDFVDDWSSIHRTNHLMKTDASSLSQPVFPQIVASAVSNLKSRLQQKYEQANPGLAEIIRIVLDQEEAKAWQLSAFPHLVLPDLVEAHIAKLNLQPARERHPIVLANVADEQQPLALCG
jgi:hypothetical protein